MFLYHPSFRCSQPRKSDVGVLFLKLFGSTIIKEKDTNLTGIFKKFDVTKPGSMENCVVKHDILIDFYEMTQGDINVSSYLSREFNLARPLYL